MKNGWQISDRRNLRKLAIRLPVMHSIFPSSLIITGVKRLGEEERISGGFADIYRGRLHDGQPVAIKRLQVFRQASEIVRPTVTEVIPTFRD